MFVRFPFQYFLQTGCTGSLTLLLNNTNDMLAPPPGQSEVYQQVIPGGLSQTDCIHVIPSIHFDVNNNEVICPLDVEVANCSPLCLVPDKLDCATKNGTVFSWTGVPGAFQYEMVIDYNDSDCGCVSDLQQDSYLTNSNVITLDETGFNNECFSWTVRAFCTDGNISPFAPKVCYDPNSGCYEFADLRDSKSSRDMHSLSGNLKLSPNPTRGTLNISYDLVETTKISINVINMDGKLVKQIGHFENHQSTFNYTWEIDSHLSPGVYFINFQTDSNIIQRKFVLIR